MNAKISQHRFWSCHTEQRAHQDDSTLNPMCESDFLYCGLGETMWISQKQHYREPDSHLCCEVSSEWSWWICSFDTAKAFADWVWHSSWIEKLRVLTYFGVLAWKLSNGQMKRPHVADTFHFYFRLIVYWPQHQQACKMPILTQRVFSDTHDVRNSFKTPINLAVTQNLNRFETTRPSSGLHVWYNPAANAAQEILKGIRHPQHTSNVAVFFLI